MMKLSQNVVRSSIGEGQGRRTRVLPSGQRSMQNQFGCKEEYAKVKNKE